MAKPKIRSAQLISPFGIGSLCEVDGQSFFVRGTGSWAQGYNLQPITVSSLADRLRPRKLKRPRDSVAITRFPRWHFCPECREMRRWTHDRDEQERRDDGSLAKPTCAGAGCKRTKLVPMRFVAVCDNGHLDEIDWHWWAHRHHQQAEHGPCDRNSARLKFEVTGKSGGDFSSMRISCRCGSSGTLEGIADGPLPQRCQGKQPGESAVACISKDEPGKPAKLYMEPRGSSALHYASVISALDIAGESEQESWAKLRSDDVYASLVRTAENLVGPLGVDATIATLEGQVIERASACGIGAAEATACFLDDISGESDGDAAPVGELTQGGILDEEFPVLANPSGQHSKYLIARPEVPGARHGLDQLFERIVRVERLREVRAFRGFQRRNVTDDQALITPSLGRSQPDWLPSVEVLGEGIFLQFATGAIKRWLDDNADQIIKFTETHLVAAERLNLPVRMGFNATPAFIMVHTFSHLLINQLSFDCGYSSTSLRERVYCGPANNPYAGILIYTADSDAEGSMGGLSEMGAPGRIEDVVYRAVSRSQWCSGDPVCRELDAQGMEGLNRAACHACSLVAETSCTFSNVLLDRVLVAGEGRTNGRGIEEPVGFFHPVLGA